MVDGSVCNHCHRYGSVDQDSQKCEAFQGTPNARRQYCDSLPDRECDFNKYVCGTPTKINSKSCLRIVDRDETYSTISFERRVQKQHSGAYSAHSSEDILKIS